MRTATAVVLAASTLTGCWKDDYAEIPPDVLQFQPPVEAPAGWLIQPFDVNLECPDGEQTRFYLLYPTAAVGGPPMAAALMLHGGSFDYVYAPDPVQPLEGSHYATPSRLTRQYAVHQIFATLGMYPEPVEGRADAGLLPTALAERDVAVLMPGNCWGDLWASKLGSAENVFIDDFFFRQGRAAAEWGWRFLIDPAFADVFDVELPIEVDPAQTYAIGLSEGGRGVAELLSIDNDEDGNPDYSPAGVLVDSPPDDLSVFLDDAGLYASVVEGLYRMYPEGESDTLRGSMYAAPLPPRVGYVYSSDDTDWPPEVHARAAQRIEDAGGWVHISGLPQSGVLNGGTDLALARDAVDYLLTGNVPARR
ncbi:MAG: hypothetical protein H6738_06255 [Alphaproteobacteria bacterium]|nr:hypothetical protein [Alphaproteobacteria bacterium]